MWSQVAVTHHEKVNLMMRFCCEVSSSLGAQLAARFEQLNLMILSILITHH